MEDFIKIIKNIKLEESRMNKLIETAPERIFLQISENTEAFNNTFPDCSNDEVTWCQDSVLDCEVEYIKEAAHKAEVEALRQENTLLKARVRMWEVQNIGDNCPVRIDDSGKYIYPRDATDEEVREWAKRNPE